MLLSNLNQYLAQQKAANLLELSRCLNAEPDVVRSMLSLLIRKGRVRQSPKIPGCGSSCGKCNPLLTEVYEWLN